MKVKIIGAGSIGNHLAQAARRMGWDVTIVDRDQAALRRTREEIYPGRYGAWDPEIKLIESRDEPKGGFDIICVGTPPHVRMPLAIEALKEKPRVLQLEKPLCSPTMKGVDEFCNLYYAQTDTVAVMGYDHAVSQSIDFVARILQEGRLGEIETLDVEFREHWGGIFKAHPWLSGPGDSYLGHHEKGGGASGEHSHALHLWDYIARLAGLGSLEICTYALDIVEDDFVCYDQIASFSFVTGAGKVGRVIQDVVTQPTRKWLRVQGKSGFIEWLCNGTPEGDVVRWRVDGEAECSKVFEKKRPDDFFCEMRHIDRIIHGDVDPKQSPVSFESGLWVMNVLSLMYENGGAAGTIFCPLLHFSETQPV